MQIAISSVLSGVQQGSTITYTNRHRNTNSNLILSTNIKSNYTDTTVAAPNIAKPQLKT